MDLDKIISEETPIYTKSRGSINEYRVIESMMVDVTEPITKLNEKFLTKLSNITGKYIALQNVDKEDDVYLIPVKVFRKAWWSESKRITKDLERLENGKPYIIEFLEKYGVLNSKFDIQSSVFENRRFGSEILYDGFSTPDSLWNSTFQVASFSVYPNKNGNIYRKRNGEVIETKLYKSLEKYDLCKALSGESIKRCHHDELLEKDERYTHHYTKEEWLKDIEYGLELYLSHLDEIVDETEDIFFNKSASLYHQKNKNYVINFLGTSYFKCEIIDKEKGKYRDHNCDISTIKKCDDICSKKDLMLLAESTYRKAVSIFDFIEFKY